MTSTSTPTRPTSSPSPSSDGLDSSFGPYVRTPLVRVAEIAAIFGLGGAAYIHLAEMSNKFSEVPYLGVGYGLMSIACAISIYLLVRGDRRGWILGGATCLATFVGFVLTRTVGLPASTDDIGNWSESIGTWSLVFEGLVVVLAATVLGLQRRQVVATA